jgi:hypothetical protein
LPAAIVLGGDPDMVGAVLADATQGLTQTTKNRTTEKGVNARRNSINGITQNSNFPDATASGRIDTRFAPNGTKRDAPKRIAEPTTQVARRRSVSR